MTEQSASKHLASTQEQSLIARLQQEQNAAGRRFASVRLPEQQRQQRETMMHGRAITSRHQLLRDDEPAHHLTLLQRIQEEKQTICCRLAELQQLKARVFLRHQQRHSPAHTGRISVPSADQPSNYGSNSIITHNNRTLRRLDDADRMLELRHGATEEDHYYRLERQRNRMSTTLSRDAIVRASTLMRAPSSMREERDSSKRPKVSHDDEIGDVGEAASCKPEPSTGAVLLAVPDDKNLLSPYQVLLRESLEFFHASEQDTRASQRGRKRSIQTGQVGIRCRFCAHLRPSLRTNIASTFPRTKSSIYMCAQNIGLAHLVGGRPDQPSAVCPRVPERIRQALIESRAESQSPSAVGRDYWEKEGCAWNLKEEDDALWLA